MLSRSSLAEIRPLPCRSTQPVLDSEVALEANTVNRDVSCFEILDKFDHRIHLWAYGKSDRDHRKHEGKLGRAHWRNQGCVR